jgi:superfamily II DNA or RNA helicase
MRVCDVPDASVVIELSGTAAPRIYPAPRTKLRKVEGKTARLVEIISRETVEAGMSRRRHPKPGAA